MRLGTPNLALAKRLNIWAWIISSVVFLVVLSMRRIHWHSPIDLIALPAVYSVINAVVALLLMMAFYSIRVKADVSRHQKLMTAAALLSALFLLLYVLYHTTHAETSYCGEGWSRPVYYFLLISHILIAAVILPFVLFTYIRAYTGQYQRHKAMARWVFPLWLYVAVTGPLLYLMLLPCYGK